MIATRTTILDRLRTWIPAHKREDFYRAVGAIVMALFGLRYISGTEATAWTQLGVATVTLLFALLHSTSPWRTALYLVVGPLGGVLMIYGLVQGQDWAVITAAIGQAFGITTAAAKTIQVPSPGS